MRISQNVNLGDFTSLHAGGRAKKLIQLDPGDGLADVVKAQAEGPVYVLGYGTNCLISDKGLAGTVIINQAGSLKLEGQRLKAESGFSWDELVVKAIDAGLWGLEFTSGIPGGVGAAVAGNIAAYGHKAADCFIEATLLNSRDGSVEIWDKDKLGFDYRSSALQAAANRHLIILDATFELATQPTTELEYDSALRVARELAIKPDSLANRRRIIIETRRRAGSLLASVQQGPWTAGSFFLNPLVSQEQVEKILSFEEHGISRDQLLKQNVIHSGQKTRVSAALVLLAAGFKRGQTWGQVRLHQDHILKIENLGQASAQDIYNVVGEIVAAVKQKLDIELKPEVRFLGEF